MILLDFGSWYKAYTEYRRISDTDASANQKEERFDLWLSQNGYDQKQRNFLTNQHGFYTQVRSDPVKYNDMKAEHIPDDISAGIFEGVGKLEPPPDKTTVQAWQKYEVVANYGAPDSVTDKAMYVYMGDSNNDHLKYQLMREGNRYTPQECAAVFHYLSTSVDRNSFIKLVTALGIEDADTLWELKGASKTKIENWKW